MSVMETIDNAITEIGEAINDLPCVRATQIGLNQRAGSVYVDNDNNLIITDRHNIRSLEYYGGFEYIDDECTYQIGNYKIYGIQQHDRVDNAIDFYNSQL